MIQEQGPGYEDTAMQPAPSNGDRLERFEDATSLPMLILSLLIIPLLIVPSVVELSPGMETTILALDWFIWAAFFLEYVMRLYLAPEKWPFIRSNKVDLVVIVLPFLRPFRILRSARSVRLLRAARGATFLLRGIDAARDLLTRHKLDYALLATLVAVVAGGLAVESFEADAAGSNIKTVPDALWWAIVTVTTIGYGDRYPVSPEGRAIAVVLMVTGVAMFSFLAANIASFFLERHEEKQIDPRLDEINQRLARIEEMLKVTAPPKPDHKEDHRDSPKP